MERHKALGSNFTFRPCEAARLVDQSAGVLSDRGRRVGCQDVCEVREGEERFAVGTRCEYGEEESWHGINKARSHRCRNQHLFLMPVCFEKVKHILRIFGGVACSAFLQVEYCGQMRCSP